MILRAPIQYIMTKNSLNRIPKNFKNKLMDSYFLKTPMANMWGSWMVKGYFFGGEGGDFTLGKN